MRIVAPMAQTDTQTTRLYDSENNDNPVQVTNQDEYVNDIDEDNIYSC